MRFNEKELALKSDGKAQMEGRLYYKKMNTTMYYYQTGSKVNFLFFTLSSIHSTQISQYKLFCYGYF